jgi:hypothetical protein
MGNMMIQKAHRVGLESCVLGLLPFGLAIFIGVQTADAKQCRVALPSSPRGHWSYRLIEGRKCWYQGQNNFPKSLLQLSEQASALSAFGKAEPPRDQELLPPEAESVGTHAEPNNQPVPDECCRTLLNDPDSFEVRWRALGMTR